MLADQSLFIGYVLGRNRHQRRWLLGRGSLRTGHNASQYMVVGDCCQSLSVAVGEWKRGTSRRDSSLLRFDPKSPQLRCQKFGALALVLSALVLVLSALVLVLNALGTGE